MLVVRSVLFNLMMYSTGALLSVYGRVLKLVAPHRVIGAGIMWSRFTIWSLKVICGVEVEIIGRENLPVAGPALIAAQHQSAFDTMVWLLLLPNMAYVLKKELLKQPLVGPLLVPAGFVPVDRAGGAMSIRKLVADCKKVAQAGKQIVIFPEGTRVPPGTRATLMPGVVAVANALHLPVIPAATDSGRFWGRNAFHKYPGRLRIKIYPPIPVGTNRPEIMARLNECFYDEGVDKSVDSRLDLLAV